MDFKLNFFGPKVSSYFQVKLKQKIVNLLILYFQFDNENWKIELIFNLQFNNANQKLNWFAIFGVKLIAEIVFSMWSLIQYAQLEFSLTNERTGDPSLKHL